MKTRCLEIQLKQSNTLKEIGMQNMAKWFGFIALVWAGGIALGGCGTMNYDRADPYALGNNENTGTVNIRVAQKGDLHITGLNFVKINGVDVDFTSSYDRVAKLILPVLLPAGNNEYELFVGIATITGGRGLDFSTYQGETRIRGKVQLNIEAGKTYFVDLTFFRLFGRHWKMTVSEGGKRIAKFPAEEELRIDRASIYRAR